MNPPTEERLGAAFRDLVADQPFTPDAPAIARRARQSRRRHRIARGGISAGVAAVAAAAAVGVASTVPSATPRCQEGRGQRHAPSNGRRLSRARRGGRPSSR